MRVGGSQSVLSTGQFWFLSDCFWSTCDQLASFLLVTAAAASLLLFELLGATFLLFSVGRNEAGFSWIPNSNHQISVTVLVLCWSWSSRETDPNAPACLKYSLNFDLHPPGSSGTVAQQDVGDNVCLYASRKKKKNPSSALSLE